VEELSDSAPEAFRELEEYVRQLAIAKRLDPEKTVEILRKLAFEAKQRGISDEDIENMTGFKQSEIRRALRLFYEEGMATYRRGRHPETGATRYYWVLNYNLMNTSFLAKKKAILEKLRVRLEHEETNTFYVCPADGSRYTFDEAYDVEFTCPKCGSLLEEEDNTGRVGFLRDRIRRLEEEIVRDEDRVYGG